MRRAAVNSTPVLGRSPRPPQRTRDGRLSETAYVAGALALDGRRVVSLTAHAKRSDPFVGVPAKLRRAHPSAPRIHPILDGILPVS